MADAISILGLFTVDLSQLTLPAIIVAGAIDSINPCAIGVLIFMSAYLIKVFEGKRYMMLIAGLMYIAAVYVAYFLAGVGLLSAIQSLTVAYWFYWIAVFIALSAAAFEMKDFFWYGQGVSMDISLVPGGSERIHLWTEKMERLAQESPWMAVAATIPIGFGVAAVELPCTGQVYLSILALMNRLVPPEATGFDRVGAVLASEAGPLLVLYNLIFVAPLIIIVLLMFFGTSSDKLERWRKQNRRYMRLGIGVLLYGLGALLLWYLFTELNAAPGFTPTQPLTFLLFISQVGIWGYIVYKGWFEE